MSDEADKAIPGHHLQPDHYLHEKVHTNVDQIIDSNNPPHDIGDAYRHSLAEPLHN